MIQDKASFNTESAAAQAECPHCGTPVRLARFGEHLSKELKGIEAWLEGWCANCAHRLSAPVLDTD